ncbi:MAG: uridine kinase [Cytophagia bacterium]|nr:uridine kinase [Cytophagia bacterium]
MLTYTIGITGGSGSGKTYLIENLSNQFKPEEICLISQDNYYRTREEQVTDEKGVKNFDLPNAIDHERFYTDLMKLKNGHEVEKLEYTFNNPNATPKTIVLKPAPIIIVEGIFVQYFNEIENELDLKIFLEAKDHVKLSRRIRRDNEQRGYDLDDVLYRYQYHVMPVYEKYIEPLKHSSDLVIPNNSHFDRAIEVLVLSLKARLQYMLPAVHTK